jgi:hypothetical protein
LELKAKRSLTDSDFQQLGANVKQADASRGLLLNFGAQRLGIRRYANDGG